MPGVTETLRAVLLGGLIATVAPILAEIIRSKRDAEIDRLKRADDRQLGRDAFQRQTLFELQEALDAWFERELERLIPKLEPPSTRALLRIETNAAARESGTAGRRLILLTERVADAQLRESLNAHRVATGSVDPGLDASERLGRIIERNLRVHEELGERLRSYV
jgi:hypothetical protein